MTLLAALTRRLRERSRFDYLTRAQLIEQIVAIEDQRDRAIARARAQRDQLASWLEQRADARSLDATHGETPAERRTVHRAVELELRQAATDLDLETR